MSKNFKMVLGLVMSIVMIFACVPADVYADTIELNINSAKLMQGQSFTLQVEKNSTGKAVSKNIKWKSDDTKVAKISKSGKVTAVNAGITFVHGTYKGKDYKCKVYVLNGCRKNGKHTWKVLKEEKATCTWEGERKMVCIECGEDKVEVIDLDPHNHEYVDEETGICDGCENYVGN